MRLSVDALGPASRTALSAKPPIESYRASGADYDRRRGDDGIPRASAAPWPFRHAFSHFHFFARHAADSHARKRKKMHRAAITATTFLQRATPASSRRAASRAAYRFSAFLGFSRRLQTQQLLERFIDGAPGDFVITMPSCLEAPSLHAGDRLLPRREERSTLSPASAYSLDKVAKLSTPGVHISMMSLEIPYDIFLARRESARHRP